MLRGIPILLYHRVGPRAPDSQEYWTVTPNRFATQMDQLAREGWQGVAIDDLLHPDLPRRVRQPVVLSFDDGFAANREHAWPVLKRHGFGATTFLVADRLGAANSWDPKCEPVYPLLGANMLSGAPPGMTFHCHSATHVNVSVQPDQRLRAEVSGARARLEEILGRAVLHYAYPFGVWSWRAAAAIQQAGYLTALTCIGGVNTPGTRAFLLRRVEIRDEDLGWRLRFKLLTGRDPLHRPIRPPSEAQIASIVRHEGLPPAALWACTLARARLAPAGASRS